MALRWDFKEKAGTVTEIQLGKEFTHNFYEGNALMIALYEYTEDDGTKMYDLMWFFCDEAHAKNCLGLKKNAQGEQSNMFGEDGITHLTIYREHCRQWQTIVNLFTKAFPHITIELLEKEA